ncbi:glutaredoxin family protein [Naasia sp. SYSU D00057]|uniref:glutaredoxin family protein n=1 Tax=Naasia sp. SYSU D00057 TaxID=2817380 RepID=UPI001B317F6E|nr:glutaredoxin family protein [Naasia sp. SYSU D00057]
MVPVTLLGKPGCHLCDDARTAVLRVLEEFPADAVEFEERSILDDPGLLERYADDIPVVLVAGRVHTYWRVDPERLRRTVDDALR